MQTVSENFLAFAVHRMKLTQKDITRCVDQLSEAQLLYRSAPYENTIANLLMHLEGNVRQWVLHGLDAQPDIRQREEEFSLASPVTGHEAKQRFDATLDEACRIIASFPQDQVMTTIDPSKHSPWRNVTVVEAVFQLVGHLQLHTGQIFLLTKQLLQKDIDLTIPRPR